MSAEDTRNVAYLEHRDSGELGAQQRTIMRFFHCPGREERDYSLNEIAQLTGIRLSSVSGRVNELKKLGYLEEALVRRDKITGRSVTPLRVSRLKEAA